MISLWFSLAFPWWSVSDVKHLCIYLLVICISFEKYLFRSFAYFIIVTCFLAIELLAFLIYFGCYPPITCMVCKYLFHSIGCGFTLWTIFFAVQKLFSLIQFFLFIFSFIAYALRVHSKKKKTLPRPMSRAFSSNHSTISGLTFRSSIYLEFISVYRVKLVSIQVYSSVCGK